MEGKVEGKVEGKRSKMESLRPLPVLGSRIHGHHGSLLAQNFASVDPSPGAISVRMEPVDTFREEITVNDSMNNSMDQSLPPSPATSTREGDMSVSDLTSIGFDSNMSSDWQSQGFLSDKSAAPSTPLKPRESRDETDPLAALLREPQYRALLNIVKFMREQGSGAPAASARLKAGGKFKVLTAACSSMVTLALQRDVLSRASALRSFVAGIPAQVGRGDLAGLRTEMKLHAGHVRDLRTLRAHFLAALPGISLPSISKVCVWLYE
ncbi:hypothetical protein T484DRAFT_1767779 [Baffinella frigidus]|nr:hypothetical protein T484DRAFT_1767779 [Cryptophyta sp. CCMP2293]